MSANIENKKNEVALISEKMKNSKAIIAFEYHGLTVEKFMQLRRNLRQVGCEVAVIKNNIARRAALANGYDDFSKDFVGPVATIFSADDIVAPAKELFNFAKENDKVKVLTGMIDGDLYSFEQLQELATLPSYETLLTQLAAGMLGTVTQLAIGLNMIYEKKSEEAQA